MTWRVEELRGAFSYLDSNVLIYALEGAAASERRRGLRQLFQDLAAGGTRACASVVVRTEVLVHPLRSGDTRLADLYNVLLSGRGALEVLAVDQGVADMAAELRAERSALRVPDALHLATAVFHGCTHFVTGDRRLRHAAGRRVRVLLLNELEGDEQDDWRET
jgi:predicted nucleic acid-binding protein